MYTRVNAVCDGFVTFQSGTELSLTCDVNGDGINNDSLEVYFDHLEKVNFVVTNSYISAGTKIAESVVSK